jgi:hypothetical protein
MPSMRIETAIPAIEGLQAYTLDRTAIWIGVVTVILWLLMSILPLEAIINAIIFGTKKLLRFWGDKLSISVGRKDRCILQFGCS